MAFAVNKPKDLGKQLTQMAPETGDQRALEEGESEFVEWEWETERKDD